MRKLTKHKIIKKINYYFRLSLFVLSIIAVTILIIWENKPSYVDKIDNYIISKYTEPYKNKITSAKIKISQGKNDEAIEILKGILVQLKDVKKRLRLADYKIQALMYLTQIYEQKENSAELLKVIEERIKYDDRDIEAQWKRIQLLIKSKDPDKKNNAELLCIEFYGKFPDWPGALNSYIKIIRNHDTDLAKEAYKDWQEILSSKMSSLKNFSLIFYWDNGNGINGLDNIFIQPRDLSFTVSFTVPKDGLRLLRFELLLDRFNQAYLYNSHINLTCGDYTKEFPINLNQVKINNIKRLSKGFFKTISQPSYLEFTIPELPNNSLKNVNVEFKADVLPALPYDLLTLVENDIISAEDGTVLAKYNKIFHIIKKNK